MTLEENLRDPERVAQLIDHTLLKPEATEDDVRRLCKEAREFRFATVCINPYWVRFAGEALAGSSVRVSTVVGFPLGANAAATKAAEARYALLQGGMELDMVQNIGALRSRDFEAVRKEIAEIAAIAHDAGAILKVILETGLLTDDQKITSCRIAAEAGVDFVKTSTGFSTGGATVADVKLMRDTVGEMIGVKASGGVRGLAALREMMAAGANRIGTSSGVQIVRELNSGKTDAQAAATSAQTQY